ncbi:MAG: aldolase/citrate lyase family protein [Euryarchaeota archaeon]|nr:aldolase/citrate lyase family protein [Euryarchaeota archaeon]
MKEMYNMKRTLKDGGVVVGPWCTIPSSSVINVVASTGMDFVIIDMEHGPHGFEAVEDMIRAAENENCAPLVRVAKNDEALILQALDIGAHGVIVPHIESREDAELAVSCAKYYPLGNRGFSPFTRAGGYSPNKVGNHSTLQNEQTMIILVLEGKDGIENLDEILNIEGVQDKVDLIYIGAYDLSQAVGHPGQVDHPVVKQHLETCINKINERGIAAGGYVAKNKNDMLWMVEMGMQFITLLPDCTIIYQAFESLYTDISDIRQDQ